MFLVHKHFSSGGTQGEKPTITQTCVARCMWTQSPLLLKITCLLTVLAGPNSQQVIMFPQPTVKVSAKA